MKSTSKHRTLKKVFLNVTACLTALVVTGNIIANECEVQLNSFLGTSSTKIVTNLPEGVTEEGYVRYYDSKYSTLAELKAAGNAKVREVEGEGIVLMKNEGSVLPLSAGAKVSLVGVTAMDPVYGGTGSGAVDADGAPNYLDVLTGAGFDVVDKPLLNWYVSEEKKRNGHEIGEVKWKQVKKNHDDTLGQGEDHTFKARPTTDFAKENLFNVLSNNYFDFEDGVTALDLFAGTGSISIELVSRGCDRVISVEKDPQHLSFISQVMREVKTDKCFPIRADVFRFIDKCSEQFDFIFADPPYALKELESIPTRIFESGILKEDGLLVLEHGKENHFEDDPHFIERRAYGSVNFSFFKATVDMIGSERAHKLICGSFIFYKALGHAERNFAADSTLRECGEKSLLSFCIKSRSFIEIGLFRKAAFNRIEHETQLFAEGIGRARLVQ